MPAGSKKHRLLALARKNTSTPFPESSLPLTLHPHRKSAKSITSTPTPRERFAHFSCPPFGSTYTAAHVARIVHAPWYLQDPTHVKHGEALDRIAQKATDGLWTGFHAIMAVGRSCVRKESTRRFKNVWGRVMAARGLDAEGRVVGGSGTEEEPGSGMRGSLRVYLQKPMTETEDAELEKHVETLIEKMLKHGLGDDGRAHTKERRNRQDEASRGHDRPEAVPTRAHGAGVG
ncbi:hypothetical protein MRB53_037883 [Persea americana]|nr:hypothetical protein MRB53_037883 [Persea americana]